MKLPAISEKQFMAQVVQLAKMLGWRVYHTHDSRRSEPGFPDLVMVRVIYGDVATAGRTIFAELKAEKGRLTAEQAEWYLALKHSGDEVYVWRPSDFDEIQRTLTSERRP